jgi:hypothetical protein
MHQRWGSPSALTHGFCGGIHAAAYLGECDGDKKSDMVSTNVRVVPRVSLYPQLIYLHLPHFALKASGK